MQLAATDEIVMASGAPPVLAKKLRYFEDGNFTRRVLPPASVEWTGDASAAAWTTWVAPPVAAEAAEPRPGETDGLALKRTREPEHEITAEAHRAEPEPELSPDPQDGADPSDDRNLETVRRAVAADRGDPDFLPEF
jgi:type IV secretion system protein VirD4